jgi:hypothetical protein
MVGLRRTPASDPRSGLKRADPARGARRAAVSSRWFISAGSDLPAQHLVSGDGVGRLAPFPADLCSERQRRESARMATVCRLKSGPTDHSARVTHGLGEPIRDHDAWCGNWRFKSVQADRRTAVRIRSEVIFTFTRKVSVRLQSTESSERLPLANLLARDPGRQILCVGYVVRSPSRATS